MRDERCPKGLSAVVPDELRGDGPCSDCGTEDNIVWFTPSLFWNVVCRPPGYESEPVLCIPCFVKRAADAGFKPTGWQLIPELPLPWPHHLDTGAGK